jgi:hypothetical protein
MHTRSGVLVDIHIYIYMYIMNHGTYFMGLISWDLLVYHISITTTIRLKAKEKAFRRIYIHKCTSSTQLCTLTHPTLPPPNSLSQKRSDRGGKEG